MPFTPRNDTTAEPGLAAEELTGYDRALADLETFKASFSLLENGDRERLVREALDRWMPNSGSFQKEMLISMTRSFWIKS